MASLRQISRALPDLGVNQEKISIAINALQLLLEELDEVEVKGRKKVDVLLGCMMATEDIIGDGGGVNG